MSPPPPTVIDIVAYLGDTTCPGSPPGPWHESVYAVRGRGVWRAPVVADELARLVVDGTVVVRDVEGRAAAHVWRVIADAARRRGVALRVCGPVCAARD